MTAPFRSVVASTIRDYLTLKRALGRQYAAEERVLAHLDQFLVSRQTDLTAETFGDWCLSFQHLASGNRRGHMRDARNLCLYRRRREPDCFVPDLRLFPPSHQVIRPHIFTDGQVAQLLTAAGTLARSANSPLRPDNMRLAIVLLYTTGLRRGELTRLTVGDYDRRERTLTIRASKFHKSRLVPVSADAAQEIQRLLGIRRQRRLPAGEDSPLLWHRRRDYSGGGFGCAMRGLFRQVGIQTAAGHVPRTHDFRHGFAVTALLRWYRAGIDVQAKLPCLAAYMGHVSIVSTAYYLHFVEPLAAAASARFGVRYLLQKYCTRASAMVPTLRAKRLHPHSMRHSTAVHLLRAGVDITTISHWLGHASVTTTTRYATVDLDMKRKAIEQAHPADFAPGSALWRTDASVLAWLEAL